MAGNNDGSGNGNGNGASSSSTNTEISAMHDFIAGGIAGSASVIVGREFQLFLLFQYSLLNECEMNLFSLTLFLHYHSFFSFDRSV